MFFGTNFFFEIKSFLGTQLSVSVVVVCVCVSSQNQSQIEKSESKSTFGFDPGAAPACDICGHLQVAMFWPVQLVCAPLVTSACVASHFTV